jgi:hypothetical protein
MTQKTIEQVLGTTPTACWHCRASVGTAQGLCDGQPCIKVFVAEGIREGHQEIPPTLEGYAVEVVETEDFEAF